MNDEGMFLWFSVRFNLIKVFGRLDIVETILTGSWSYSLNLNMLESFRFCWTEIKSINPIEMTGFNMMQIVVTDDTFGTTDKRIRSERSNHTSTLKGPLNNRSLQDMRYRVFSECISLMLLLSETLVPLTKFCSSGSWRFLGSLHVYYDWSFVKWWSDGFWKVLQSFHPFHQLRGV